MAISNLAGADVQCTHGMLSSKYMYSELWSVVLPGTHTIDRKDNASTMQLHKLQANIYL
jgi:hypothetical protein